MIINRLNPRQDFGKPLCALLLVGSMFSTPLMASVIPARSVRIEAPVRAEKVLKGKVLDEDNAALPGVSIVVKGTSSGTITDPDGNFELKVDDQAATLVLSFIGYITQEVVIGNKSSFDVIMAIDSKELTEVVVVGYGSQRKADITSSIVRVTQENFVKTPALDAGQLLQGKVAGLTISAPSGDPTQGSQILLRGNTTLLGANSNPLVLIDGVPGDLKTVAPEDIESMDVLKDGSAAAIYGTRGTNGVIIVTTKRANGNYNSSVQYNTSFSTQQVARQLDMLTAADYRDHIAQGIRDPSWDLGSDTDWMKEISKKALSQVHNLTFRGGSHRTNYLVNLNYRNLDGIFIKSENKTFNGRADVNHTMLNDKLSINLGFINSYNSFPTTGDGVSFNGYTYRQAIIQNPTAPLRNPDGSWFQQTGIFNYDNPVARLRESDGRNNSQNTRLTSNISYTPTNDLKLSALFSYNQYNQNRGYSESKSHVSALRDGRNGYASIGSVRSVDKLMELTAQYSKNLDRHKVSLLGGYSYQDNTFSDSYMQNWDFPTDKFSYNNIGIGDALKTGLAPIGSSKRETNLIGFFARATYNFDDRYLLLASIRHEGASQLYGAKNPWGTFSAVSLGWRISNEGFMKDQTIFDDLKLRAGYGVTGTQPNDLFLGVAILNYQKFFYSNGKWVQTLVPAQNPNPGLRWEEKHESNIGLDFAILKNRISGSIDLYNRKIKGLLYDFQVPSPPNLYTSTRANVGVMENRGIEVLVNFVPVQTKNFTWNANVNYSTNTNKLVSLSNDMYKTTNDFFTTGATGDPVQTFTHIVRIGDQVGDFYGFKVVDISDDGKWIYEGRDGQPQNYDDFQHAFEDKRVLGNGLPKFYLNVNNNLRYKNFDLGVTMRGAFKYQILNYQRMFFESTGLQQYNNLKSSYDKVFDKAVLSPSMPQEFNSHYVEDGDFWKIDNITLGYDIKNIKTRYIKAIRVYGSTLNTFTFTKYKGVDPEVGRLGLSPGNDSRDKYPMTRTFTLGVNLSL
jgi:TonB-linked SusC/RagA family outer membrane protein